jgi:hypothetical protein
MVCEFRLRLSERVALESVVFLHWNGKDERNYDESFWTKKTGKS